MKQKNTVLLYLSLSGIGMVLLSAVVLTSSSSAPMLSFFEKLLLGSIFVFLCIIGASLCLRPNWMKAVVLKKNTVHTNQEYQKIRCFIGHHPDCSVFDHHRIVFGKKTWCAGCAGLLLGCVLSSALMVLYVFWFPLLDALVYRVLFFFGMLCIILVYAELLIGSHSRFTHVITNSMLVLSFLFITICIAELSGDVIDGFFTIVFCILWLDSRILLSKWRHNRLCSTCPETCKTYS